MPANKLACQSFMDAGRRHETPGSETKDLMIIVQQAASSGGFLTVTPASKSHRGGNHYTKREEPEPFIMFSKCAFSFVSREILSLSSKTICYGNGLEMSLQLEQRTVSVL